MISLLGLPGLYQNWIVSVIDTNSRSKLSGKSNFETNSDAVNWVAKLQLNCNHVDSNNQSVINFHIDEKNLIEKLEIDCNHVDPINQPVINCYVDNKNFVWYLYNFLEKTDGIEIKVDSLMHDLFTKGKGTEVFNGLLQHLIASYNLDIYVDVDYQQNAAIEYFYFYLILLEKESKFKTLVTYKNPNFVNIEYQDFSNYTILSNHLCKIPNFDLTRLEHKYQQLQDRNNKYLFRQQQFLSKLDRADINFDILEWAYIGALLYWQNGTKLDWFNTSIRQHAIKHQWNDICINANKLL